MNILFTRGNSKHIAIRKVLFLFLIVMCFTVISVSAQIVSNGQSNFKSNNGGAIGSDKKNNPDFVRNPYNPNPNYGQYRQPNIGAIPEQNPFNIKQKSKASAQLL